MPVPLVMDWRYGKEIIESTGKSFRVRIAATFEFGIEKRLVEL